MKNNIEFELGWGFGIGGFHLGYKHDVNVLIKNIQNLMSVPLYGYQSKEKVSEFILVLNKVKREIISHYGGANCTQSEKNECLEMLDLFISELGYYVQDVENKDIGNQGTNEFNVSKIDNIKSEISKYGFFSLDRVKDISKQNQETLIKLIGTKSLPYCIAMFDFLGFLNHLETVCFKTKYKRNIEVSRWFNSDKAGRTVKGNISVLSEHSTENKSKYTAYIYKETVKKDYQNLK